MFDENQTWLFSPKSSGSSHAQWCKSDYLVLLCNQMIQVSFSYLVNSILRVNTCLTKVCLKIDFELEQWSSENPQICKRMKKDLNNEDVAIASQRQEIF